MSDHVLVRLPVDLVERLAPGDLNEAQGLAADFPEEDREVWVAGRVGISVAQALHDIARQAQERRVMLIRLLDQVAAE